MAVTALSGQRWQGSSTAEKTPTYETDFSATTGWTSNDTHVYIDTANTMLEFHNNASSIDEFLQYDFGSGNVSDDNWILRFEMYFNNLDLNGTGGQTNQMCFGFTDNASLSGETPSGDNLRFTMDAGAGSYLDRLTSIDGGSATHTDVTNDPFSTSTSIATPYYVEIKRVSDSSVEMRVFTTSDYSTTQYGTTITRATSSSVTNLRYLTVNIFSLTVTGDGCTGYLKNLKFWNDATTATQDDKSTVTDVPAGSEFEQTDDYKTYQASNSSTDSDGYGTVATDNSGETKNLVFDAGGAVVGDFTFRGTYTAVGGSTAWHGDASIWVADKDVAYKTSGSDDGVTGLCAVWKHESSGYSMWSRFTDFTDRTEIHRCVESGNPYTDCAGIFGNDGAAASFGTNINVEMARTGTTLTMKLYNSDWSSVTDTATRTSVISTKLRYFSFGGQHDGSITFTNSYSAITFDGIKWVERGTAI